jgi:hypothetical protein
MNNTDLFLFSRIEESLIQEILPSMNNVVRKHVLNEPKKILKSLRTSWWRHDDIISKINQQIDNANLIAIDEKPFMYADAITIPIRQQLYIYFQLYANILNCSKFSGVEKYSQPFLDVALKKWIELTCFFISNNLLLPFSIYSKTPEVIADDYKEIERLIKDGIQKSLAHLTKTFTWEYTFNRFLSLADKQQQQQQQSEQKEGQPSSSSQHEGGENKHVVVVPPPAYTPVPEQEKKTIQMPLPVYMVSK